ncbi:hypothetical protein [Parvularcula sp. LCG005]|uniref:hypothetical protein n=1 Tax=Parvularcula sp. LCG005 TaxID=3078805 RepID=UPI002942EDE7|nr:hypothetical protein [Parvularcula sp. LCG005]WOI53051.1 hypothetical protein RUI03_12940 [Parvularcula sp. LCG005]
MRLIGSIVAWLFAAFCAYGLAIGAGQTLDLNNLAEMGVPMPMGVRLEAIWDSLFGAYLYAVVLVVGFAIAFYVASLVKAAVPVLSLIAYPVAGAAAVFVALSLMKMKYDLYPVPGGSDPLGLWVHLACGLVGGIVFELFRPKRRD